MNNFKYPIEIELTDFCSLECICCPNRNFQDKWNISDENFYLSMDYVHDNLGNILFLDLCGVWDIFLHPKIDIYLEYLWKKFIWTNLEILIPTKWTIIKDSTLEILKQLKEEKINFNISIWFYSMRPKIHDKIAWWNSFQRTLSFIAKLQAFWIPFSLELLINKFSINELEYFYSFGNKLWVNYKIHNYHNFWGSLEKNDIFNYNTKNYKFKCSFADDETYELDFYCKYTLPFVSKDWYLYSCSHWWKQEKYKTEKISYLFKKFPKYQDLLNYIIQEKLNHKICKNCTYFKYNYEK